MQERHQSHQVFHTFQAGSLSEESLIFAAGEVAKRHGEEFEFEKVEGETFSPRKGEDIQVVEGFPTYSITFKGKNGAGHYQEFVRLRDEFHDRKDEKRRQKQEELKKKKVS